MENSSSQYPAYTVSVTKAKTADFKIRIAQGLPLPENPYSLVITRAPNVKVEHGFTYPGSSFRSSGFIMQSLINNMGWSESNRRTKEAAWISKLNNQVLEKIKGQSLPIVQLYVERKGTASALTKLIADSIFVARNVKRPSKIFKKFGKSTKTKTYKKVRNSVKLLASKDSTVGDAWLQYRMFLIPTYHDVMSSFSAAADFEKKSHTTQVKSKVSFKENLSFNNDAYDFSLVPTNHKKGTISVIGGASMRVTYSITDASLSALTSLADPLASGWDLVPWSFIIDRFVDLGSYLELRNATVGTTFKSGSTSYFFEWNAVPETPWVQTYYRNALLWSINGYKYEFLGMDKLSFNEVSTGRKVLKAYPPVTLEYPFNQGWKQVTDEIVLLRQLLGRRLR